MEEILKRIRLEQSRLDAINLTLKLGEYEVCRAILTLAETVARASAAGMANTPEPTAPAKKPPTAPAKKPYTPPVLTEYGSIGKLTQSGASSVRSDIGPRPQRKEQHQDKHRNRQPSPAN